MALIQPQLPRPQPIQQGSKWSDIWNGFGLVSKQDASLRQYLQNYLTRVYQWLVPFKYQVTIVDSGQSPYQVQPRDTFVGIPATPTMGSGVQLPLASGSGRVIIVKKMDAGPMAVTVVPAVTDTIDGGLSQSITTAYGVLRLIDGAQMQWLTW